MMKKQYEIPSINIVQLNTSDIICASSETTLNYDGWVPGEDDVDERRLTAGHNALPRRNI